MQTEWGIFKSSADNRRMPMRVQSKVLVCVQLTLLQPDVNKYAKQIHFKKYT